MQAEPLIRAKEEPVPQPKPQSNHPLSARTRRGEDEQGLDPAAAADPSTHIGSDTLSPAHLALRTWTAPADRVRFVEMVAEDTETQARVRVDLSTAQAVALRDCLDELLNLQTAA